MREFDYLQFKWHVAALRFEVAALRHWQLLRKARFRPDQPRDEDGKWTAEGEEEEDNGQSGQSSFDEHEAESDDSLDHFILAASGRGHHIIPSAEFRKYSFSDDARRVFDGARTGPIQAEPHGWSAEHKIYNDAVGERLREFLTKNNIQPENMTRLQAEQFLNDVKRSTDPRIREFNVRIYMKEIMRGIRLIRRPDA